MKCRKCGSELLVNAKYCTVCGTKITKPRAKKKAEVVEEVQVEEVKKSKLSFLESKRFADITNIIGGMSPMIILIIDFMLFGILYGVLLGIASIVYRVTFTYSFYSVVQGIDDVVTFLFSIILYCCIGSTIISFIVLIIRSIKYKENDNANIIQIINCVISGVSFFGLVSYEYDLLKWFGVISFFIGLIFYLTIKKTGKDIKGEFDIKGAFKTKEAE